MMSTNEKIALVREAAALTAAHFTKLVEEGVPKAEAANIAAQFSTMYLQSTGLLNLIKGEDDPWKEKE